MRALVIGLILLAGAPAAVAARHSPAPHEHGTAELRVAVADRSVRIEFDTPMDNLTGFEHAPRTEKDRQALAGAEEALRRFERLFQLPSAASCSLTDIDLHSPWQERNGHDHETESGHHADMQVTYDLECSNPHALTELQVILFESFPRIHRIRTETATPRGQSSLTLDRAKRTVPL